MIHVTLRKQQIHYILQVESGIKKYLSHRLQRNNRSNETHKD